MASPLSFGIEGKVSSMSREKPCGVLSKMAAPKLVIRSAHALEKPPDKGSCKGDNFFASYDVFLRHNTRARKQHGGQTRSAERKVEMNFNQKYLYFNTI